MPRRSDLPKTKVEISLNAKTIELAERLDLDLAQLAESLVTAEVSRLYWTQWNEENKEAIAAYNERVRKDGLPLAKYRTFYRSAT